MGMDARCVRWNGPDESLPMGGCRGLCPKYVSVRRSIYASIRMSMNMCRRQCAAKRATLGLGPSQGLSKQHFCYSSMSQQRVYYNTYVIALITLMFHPPHRSACRARPCACACIRTNSDSCCKTNEIYTNTNPRPCACLCILTHACVPCVRMDACAHTAAAVIAGLRG